MFVDLGWCFFVLAILGAVYTFASGFAVNWFFARTPAANGDYPPLTILKPLHGDEPGLLHCLSGFCTQDYPGPVQIVFGVREVADPALDVVRRLQALHPGVDMTVVVDDRVYGANLKISNLVNMEAHARHPVLVVADSDVSVPPDYLRRLVEALTAPKVGFATCVFVGVPTGNLWSQLAAMAINHHFLPSVAFGLRLRLAKPCFGPTIALRRSVLDEAGGFMRFVDRLADDFEIGRAIRELGYDFAVPNLVIGHGCPERSFGHLLGRELRWAKTIRLIDPWAYVGSLVCHPLISALAAVVLLRAAPASLDAAALVLAARVFVISRVDRFTTGAGRLWLTPAREVLSAVVYLWAYVGRHVMWRGRRFRIGPQGALIAHGPLAENLAARPALAANPAGELVPVKAVI
jgi:ceramide glucosyltransferase